MKKLEDRIERTDKDVPCSTCQNSFRTCPMELVLAQYRVPAGMEVAVISCPEYKRREQ